MLCIIMNNDVICRSHEKTSCAAKSKTRFSKRDKKRLNEKQIANDPH